MKRSVVFLNRLPKFMPILFILSNLLQPIIRRFLGNHDVMHV
jgi:hypothetical protein